MASRKKHNGSCVTRQECTEAMEPLKNTLAEIKNALIGKDLTGGLVQTVNNLNNKVANLIIQWEDQKSQNAEKRRENFRWKMAALAFGFSLLGFLLENLFNHFWH